jgi:peptidoglycan/LPS O-acetylase OafA/YrhL
MIHRIQLLTGQTLIINYISSLTGLRFFAAAAVVLGHAIPNIVIYDNPPYFLFALSATGVGSWDDPVLYTQRVRFVIFLNYSKLIDTGIDRWNFFVARFARLYPAIRRVLRPVSKLFTIASWQRFLFFGFTFRAGVVL